MPTIPVPTYEEFLYNLKKDKKIFKKKNEKNIKVLLIDDVYLNGTYDYNDYKEQLKNLKTISIVNDGSNQVVLKNFPVENLRFPYSFQYKNFRFINFYNIKELEIPKYTFSIQNLLDDLTSLEKLTIPYTSLDAIHTLNNNVKTLIINNRYGFKDLKFNVENKNVEVYPDDDDYDKYSYSNLHIYDDNSSITYSIYGYGSRIVEIEYVYYNNFEIFDLSNLIDEYNVEEKHLDIGNCKKITCKKSDLEKLKGKIKLFSYVDEIEIVDNDEMLLQPKKVNFKRNEDEDIDIIDIIDNENIIVTLKNKFNNKTRKILIKDFNIIDFNNDEVLYFSDCQKISMEMDNTRVKKFILDSYNINGNYISFEDMLKNHINDFTNLEEIVIKKGFNINNLGNVNVNCNYLTFEFGLKCENSLTVNTDNDITIKILHQNSEEKVKLLKNTKYKIFSSDEMMIIERKNDRYKFQDIITLKNDDLFHFTKKSKIDDKSIDLNINLEYLDKLNKLGIDRRVLYYTYYFYKNNYPFKDIKEVLDNLIVNLDNGKYDLEDIKNINNYGNTLVKSIRR